MKLQTSYDAMSDVPTGYEGAYSETDGKAVLTGGDFEFKTEVDVSAMKTAKDRANTELSESKVQLKKFDGIDPEKHRGMLNELDVLRTKVKGGTGEEEIKEIVDIRVARRTEELTTSNKTLQTENDELKGFKSSTEKKTTLNEALTKSIGKEMLPDAKYIIGSAVDRQADGTYMSNGKAGFEKGLSLEQVVAKAVESRPHWKKQNTPGHGAGGGKGGASTGKMTQLMELTEKNKKGELTRVEKKQMEKLAVEIKTEQQGN